MSMMVNSFVAAPVSSDPSSTQWRLYMPDTFNSAASTVLREVEMLSSADGTDLCNGGTASASSNGAGGTTPDKAFNNVIGTADSDAWSTNVSTTGSAAWLQYTFAAAVTIRAIRLAPYNWDAFPTEIQVQYYNGSIWVTWWTVYPATGDVHTYQWLAFSLADTLFTSLPSISGSYASTGDVANVSYSASSGTPTYQWYRDGVAISGATGSSYTRTDSDPILLTCEVTLNRDGFNIGGAKAMVLAPNGGAFVGRAYDFTQVALLAQNSDGTGAITADGDPVGLVRDIGCRRGGTEGRNLAQYASTTRRPLYRNTSGIKSIEFDGSNDYLQMPSLRSYAAGGHVVYSMKLDNDPPTVSNGGAPIGQTGSSTASDHHPYIDGNIYQGFMSTVRRNTGNPSTSMASWHYEDMWSFTNDWGLALNGTNHYTTATNTVAKADTPFVGSHIRDQGAEINFLDGRIGRMLLSESKLTGNALSSARAWVEKSYT